MSQEFKKLYKTMFFFTMQIRYQSSVTKFSGPVKCT